MAGLFDLAMKEALFETVLFRGGGLSSVERFPDWANILRFHHQKEQFQFPEKILAAVNTRLTDKQLMLREGEI